MHSLYRTYVANARHVLELSSMLLDIILETHAWASARPKHEAAMETQKLEEHVSRVIEKEQGMSSPAPSFSSSPLHVTIIVLSWPFASPEL